MISVTVSKNFTDAQIARQLPFATARAFTQTVKDAQSDIIGGLDDRFTIRNNWYKPSTPFGIKTKGARKTDLSAEVGTNADWLADHEEGQPRRPRRSRRLALPVIGSIARKTIRNKIPRASTPARLIESGRAFVMTNRAGKTGIYVFKKGVSREVRESVLLNIEQRNNRKFRSAAARNTFDDAPFELAFGLEPTRRIRKNSAIIEPAVRTIARRLNPNFQTAMDSALKTAR